MADEVSFGGGLFDEKAGALDDLFDWEGPDVRLFILDPATREPKSK